MLPRMPFGLKFSAFVQFVQKCANRSEHCANIDSSHILTESKIFFNTDQRLCTDALHTLFLSSAIIDRPNVMFDNRSITRACIRLTLILAIKAIGAHRR